MGSPADPDRVAALEASLRSILHEARMAGDALCQNEVMVRLENIARLAEGVLAAKKG